MATLNLRQHHQQNPPTAYTFSAPHKILFKLFHNVSFSHIAELLLAKQKKDESIRLKNLYVVIYNGEINVMCSDLMSDCNEDVGELEKFRYPQIEFIIRLFFFSPLVPFAALGWVARIKRHYRSVVRCTIPFIRFALIIVLSLCSARVSF